MEDSSTFGKMRVYSDLKSPLVQLFSPGYKLTLFIFLFGVFCVLTVLLQVNKAEYITAVVVQRSNWLAIIRAVQTSTNLEM